NADQIALGTLHSNRLSGNYTGISGIGTITTGIWKAKPIEDAYIDNELTLNGASLTGTNLISGNIRLTGPTVITGNQSLAIASPSWNITADGDLTLSSVLIDNTIFLSKNIIQFTSFDGFHSKPNVNQGLFISPTGSVGINTTTPSSKFHVNGGIRLGDTDVGIDGMLRFKNDKFEGYRDNKWVQLDYEANFDSHALHAEGDQIKNLIYVTSAGNVGIGGIPSPNISDHLTVSGNVIFKGRSLGTNQTSLNVAGNGTRMFWYPKKTAFRAGYVDTNEWDDANIGVNSVVFGHSGKASGAHTTIIGGRNQINQGESSVIIGGYSNEIKSGSNYSVIIGGGSATGGGNLIDGGQYSTILGGQSNKITGDYSTILGGLNNTISGDYSAALGSNINIGHNGTFIFSDGQSPRASSADYQFLVYASGHVGIGIEPV
ncbi:MAG: hypothetical protein VW397_08790, partial [Candidatus Margulisiibacteriota bacterium]